VDSSLYGLTVSGKEVLVGVNASDPEIAVEKCSDGTVPSVMVNDEIYSIAKKSNNADSKANELSDYKTISGPSINIQIEKCSDGQLAGIRYNRVFYGDNPNIPLDSKSSPNAGGFETIKLTSGIQFSVEICNDGLTQRIDNVLY
jgi:hypothetical protein